MTQTADTVTHSVAQSIAASERLGFNSLYLDFLRSTATAAPFYPAQDPRAVAAKIDRAEYSRDQLADILRRQNERFGAKPATLAAIERFRDPQSVVVFAGQQAGLFGGPLLGFYKALWAVKEARRLEAELGRPALPIFWIAADDHDFDEINHTFVYDMLGEPEQVSYFRSDEEGRPAYQRLFSCNDVYREACDKLRAALGETDFTEDLYSRLFASYHDGADFVGAFGSLMADLMPDIGLALFSPGDAEFKTLARPFYRALLQRRAELKRVFNETNERLVAAGYHVQVQKDDSACHMFVLTPAREALHAKGEGYQAGATQFSAAELERLIETEPERLSPDVITRPILAATLFPTIAQGGGPSEVAYFAQLAPLYELFGCPTPCFSGRISATLIEKRFERFLEKHQLEVEDFTGDIEQVVNATLGKTFPADLEERFAQTRRLFKERFDEVAAEVVRMDKSLEKNAGQMWGKIDHTLTSFEKKAFSSHKRKYADERAAIYRAGAALFPRGALQERSINLVYYLSRYGYRLVDFLVERLALTTTEHQLVNLSEMDT
ncbi:MAG TPA: bacillithiol biosynthesis cysteine-adding enzyme BshC [candidate division Zixibacteria bacterium]|nr:bacillithiol biosynthesis cysteine-adding enzyme BshC [candidate division Zixibacteria bacterium]